MRRHNNHGKEGRKEGRIGSPYSVVRAAQSERVVALVGNVRIAEDGKEWPKAHCDKRCS